MKLASESRDDAPTALNRFDIAIGQIIIRWIRPSFGVVLMDACPICIPLLVGALRGAHAHIHPRLAQQHVLRVGPSPASVTCLLAAIFVVVAMLFVSLPFLVLAVVAILFVALAELLCVGVDLAITGDDFIHHLGASILRQKNNNLHPAAARNKYTHQQFASGRSQ